jgi:thioesterase domain-containing protein
LGGIMDIAVLEQYLHHQIPLSEAMQVTVDAAGSDSVVLSAPLEPNINHKRTAFGGSISTLGILAAWSLVHLRLLEEGLRCEVVIQSNQMDYDRPITGAFSAASSLRDPAGWPTFLKTLTRRKMARIEVCSDLLFEETVVGRLSGRFVAFLQEA